MKSRLLTLLILLTALCCYAVNSRAEPRDDADRPLTRGQMEKIRERVESLRIWKLTKALDLDEKTSSKLFPLLNKYDRRRAEIEHALRSDMKDLRDSLQERREGRLKSILDKLEHNHRALQTLNDEERTELKSILTVEQQAKFILFQQEFSRDLRRIIAEAREKKEKSGREQAFPFEKPRP